MGWWAVVHRDFCSKQTTTHSSSTLDVRNRCTLNRQICIHSLFFLSDRVTLRQVQYIVVPNTGFKDPNTWPVMFQSWPIMFQSAGTADQSCFRVLEQLTNHVSECWISWPIMFQSAVPADQSCFRVLDQLSYPDWLLLYYLAQSMDKANFARSNT